MNKVHPMTPRKFMISCEKCVLLGLYYKRGFRFRKPYRMGKRKYFHRRIVGAINTKSHKLRGYIINLGVMAAYE